MATVYLAIQESLGRPVVLKILDSDRIESDQWTERFLTEGRLVASLHHPNIVTIYDIGLSDDELYISMEFVEGGDLKQKMELPMLPHTCLDYLIKIAEALDAAHKHGIVHRDVKPANILFRDEETPLLTDFGIAKEIDGDLDLTSTGIFLGSPNYVSPEQSDGLAVDGRSDIYSMGCILYEMLTGKKPFVSESVVEIVIQHKQAPIPQLPEEYSNFQPLLDRMMAKKREDRFRDCRALISFMQELKNSITQQHEIFTDYDLTVADTVTGTQPIQEKSTGKNLSPILTGLLAIALLGNIVLHFIENKLNSAPEMPSATELAMTADLEKQIATTADSGTLPQQTASPEIKRALLWLGKQSLEEFKLTQPAKDNAWYYYNKLLEVEPNNQEAQTGILKIADRYAVLAEQSVANNKLDEARSYINVGLKIDPENKSLHNISLLLEELGSPSMLDTLKSFFN